MLNSGQKMLFRHGAFKQAWRFAGFLARTAAYIHYQTQRFTFVVCAVVNVVFPDTSGNLDYVLMAENDDFAVDLESALKRNPKITTASYFEAHTQLTQTETHLLYEIRNI